MYSPKLFFRKKRNFLYVSIFILVFVVSSIGYSYANVPAQTALTYQINQYSGVQPCSENIFFDGTYYYGKNCVTGSIDYGGINNLGGGTGTSATSVINAILTAQSTTGGFDQLECATTFDLLGALTFTPSGQFNTGITLNGCGSSSILQLHSGANYDALIIGNGGSTPALEITISNLQLYGNHAGGNGINLKFSEYDTRLQNLLIDNFAGNCINDATNGNTFTLTDSYLRACTYGIYASSADIAGFTVSNTQAEFNTKDGFYVANAEAEVAFVATVSDLNTYSGYDFVNSQVRATSLISQDNLRYGIYATGAVTISDYTVRRNDWQGLRVQSTNANLANGLVSTNAFSLTGAPDSEITNLLCYACVDVSITNYQSAGFNVSNGIDLVFSQGSHNDSMLGGSVSAQHGVQLKLDNGFEKQIIISGVNTFNPAGLITYPFATTSNPSEILPCWSSSTCYNSLTANVLYTVGGSNVFVNSTGGTGVSITIEDNYGNTILSSAKTLLMFYLPVGYQINFGGYSVAPTVKIYGA